MTIMKITMKMRMMIAMHSCPDNMVSSCIMKNWPDALFCKYEILT